jgi:pimeloyl-ACP methyl ester carboxylesterase
MFPADADPDLVEWVASDMAAAPPEVAVPAIEHARGNEGPILARLPRLTAPFVAINPDASKTDVESLRRYGIETKLMPAVGHFPMLEDQGAFNRLLAETVDAFTA